MLSSDLELRESVPFVKGSAYSMYMAGRYGLAD